MASTRTPRTDRSTVTRQAIRAGAVSCFGRLGYSGASMDAIAAASGVTKPTVYAHFGSKDALFTELLRDRLGALDRLPISPASDSAAVEAAITDYASRRIDVMLEPATLGLLRAASAEGIRRPEWATSLIGSLEPSDFERWLDEISAAGLLEIGSPEEAAELFWAQLEGALFFPVVVGMTPTPDQHTRSRVVAASVHSFMCTHRPAPPAPDKPTN